MKPNTVAASIIAILSIGYIAYQIVFCGGSAGHSEILIELLALVCLAVSSFSLGNISAKDDVNIMERRVSRKIDEKYDKLVRFVRFSQTLVNNEAPKLVQTFIDDLKKEEGIDVDESESERQ